MKHIVMALMLSLLASCGAQQIKNPSMATLQNKKYVVGESNMSGMFKAINKKELKVGAFTTPNQAAHSVNSGAVYIYAFVTLSGKSYSGVNAADYIFPADLKAGGTYTLKPTLKGNCIEVYLESEGGDKVGPFVQPWHDYDSPARIISMMSLEANKASSEKCKS